MWATRAERRAAASAASALPLSSSLPPSRLWKSREARLSADGKYGGGASLRSIALMDSAEAVAAEGVVLLAAPLLGVKLATRWPSRLRTAKLTVGRPSTDSSSQ